MTALRETSQPTSTKSVNAKLLRDLIRARVQLSKVEARIFRRDFLPALRRMELELLAQLEDIDARGLSDVRRSVVDQMLREVRAIIKNAADSMKDAGKSALADVASREARLQQAALSRVLPSSLSVELGTLGVEQLATLVKTTAKDVFAPYVQTWGERALKKAKSAIEDSVLIGEDMAQAGRRLRAAIGATKHEALMMARTGIQAVAHKTTRAYQDENEEVLKGVQWVSTLDTRTCPVCGALDGKVWSYGTPGPNDEGRVDAMPTIPIHAGCRCSTAGIVKSWRELGLDIDDADIPGGRASMNGEVPDSLTYEDWLKDQPEKVQRAVLGISRFELFKSGQLDLSDFSIDLRRRTLDELREL